MSSYAHGTSGEVSVAAAATVSDNGPQQRMLQPPATATTSTTAVVVNDSSVDLDNTAESYKGFGSFHSENVEDLIHATPAQYRPPAALPDWGRWFTGDALTERARALGRHLSYDELRGVFGRQLRESHYMVDPSWTFMNHGAFGGALRPAVMVKHQFEMMMEAQPLFFVDRTLLPLLVYSTRSLATFLNARPQDVVLVSNATFGLNAAVNATLRHATDVVVYLDTEYGSVWKMLREACNKVGCSGVEIPLAKHFRDASIMASDEAVTAYIESQLPDNCTTFVVDHLASTSAIGLPVFTHLVPMLKRKGVKHIVVDGAHGPLQHDLDFEALTPEQRPTVYIGNLHKWVSSPKSVGFIWARPDIQKRMHSPVVSHGSRAGYLSEFIWDGTKDYGAYLSLPSVIDFWTNTIGVDNARRYCKELMAEAEQLLNAGWNTTPVPRGGPFMKLVELPSFLQDPRFSAKFIQDTLHARYRVELPVKTVDSKLYVRLSVFVNNERADYEVLRDAVNDLASVLRKRQREAALGGGEQQLSQPKPAQPRREDCGGCGIPIATRTQGFDDDDDSGDGET